MAVQKCTLKVKRQRISPPVLVNGFLPSQLPSSLDNKELPQSLSRCMAAPKRAFSTSRPGLIHAGVL